MDMPAWPPWFPGAPLPGLPGSTTAASLPSMDAAAAMALQRQQAEAAFQQAWQNLTVLNEMSAKAAAQAEEVQTTQAKPEEKNMEETKKEPLETPADARTEQKDPVPSTPAPKVPHPSSGKETKPGDVKHEEGKLIVPAGKIVVRIRKVGSFQTGDGTLDVFCRFTPNEDQETVEVTPEDVENKGRDARPASASAAGDVKKGEDAAEYVKPRPKKRPIIPKAKVREPNHPPPLVVVHSWSVLHL